MSLPGIPISWAYRHCTRVVAEGISIDRLFNEALIEQKFGDDRDRVSAPQLALFYFHANLSIEDESRRNTRSRIPIGFGALAVRALFGCSTLEAALGAVIHLAEMTSASMRFAVTTNGEEARLISYCEDGKDGADAASLEDSYLSFLFMCLNYFLAAPMPLLGVETRDPTHMNLDGAHWATRAYVRLGSLSALRFPKSLLAAKRAVSPQDEMFWDIFRGWIDFVEGDRIERGPRVVTSSIESLALNSGVSRATIRRRLDQDVGGFQRNRQAELTSAGLDLLLNTRDSVDAIAVSLGYADARSFRRFLKRSTGKAPVEWRQAYNPAIKSSSAVRRQFQNVSRVMDGQLKPVPLFPVN